MKCTEGLLFLWGQNDHFDVREETGCSRSYIATNGAPSNRNHQPQVEDKVCLAPFPIIMEVENCYIWKVTTIGGTHS